MARIDTAEGSLTLPISGPDAWARIIDVLGTIGIVEEQRVEEQRVIGVVPSGFGNMNGAYVEIQVLAVRDSATAVKIQASAQEGLIKQKAASKAVDRLVTELS